MNCPVLAGGDASVAAPRHRHDGEKRAGAQAPARHPGVSG